MAVEKEVTETVKKTSDGMVKISLEAYQELLEKANKPTEVIRRVVQKTPQMVKEEHVAWGATMMGGGFALLVIGGIRFWMGQRTNVPTQS